MVRNGGDFFKEVFQSRKTMGMEDIGVRGSHISRCHEGVGRKCVEEGSYDIKGHC